MRLAPPTAPGPSPAWLFGLLLATAWPSGWAAAQPASDATPSPSSAKAPESSPTEPRVRHVVPEPLQHNHSQRRIIRGCPSDDVCAALLDELATFELEAFAPGSEVFTRPAASVGDGSAASVRARPSKPSEIRPELAWMDSLKMPDLPVVWDERLITYLLHYKDSPNGRALMRSWLRAQGRYAPMILERLERAHLPKDLIYVAMIESSYNVRDSSYAGASGLWQFMPPAARIYGLKLDRWVDERNDPVRSTDAVVDFFHDLHHRFGDWHLALAAYNAGYGAVLKAITRYNSNDYWQLIQYENGLPWDTQLYVSKALAVAIIGHNRAAFGFDDVEPLPAEQWDLVSPKPSTPLAAIAKAAGCSVEDIKRLNPHIRQGRTPPDRKGFTVRVPKGLGLAYERRISEVFDSSKLRPYVVRYGERLEDIATIFGTSVSNLRRINDISRDAEVSGGLTLYVPQISPEVEQQNREIAKQELHSSGVDSQPGEPLIVAVPSINAEAGTDLDKKRRVFYRVVVGDELADLAAALGVGTTELAAWNGLPLDVRLHPKMVLQAWVDPDTTLEQRVVLLDDSLLVLVDRGSKEHLDLLEQRTGRERIEYVATKRESFADIGKKYGLHARDVSRINRKPASTVVEPGTTVVVYRVVDKTRSARAKEQWAKTPKAKVAKAPSKASKKSPAKSNKGRGVASTKSAKSTKAKTNSSAGPTAATQKSSAGAGGSTSRASKAESKQD